MFFKRRTVSNRALMDRLHGEIVEAARRPVFYLDLGVPDTFEGRFELLALHAGLLLRRLNAAEPPGPAAAQDLVDMVFARLEAGLREAGVGDMAVPKRMKRLAEAFLGRSAAYDGALRTGRAALEAALSRNVYGGQRDAARLAAYVAAVDARLAATSLDRCLGAPMPFPDPVAASL